MLNLKHQLNTPVPPEINSRLRRRERPAQAQSASSTDAASPPRARVPNAGPCRSPAHSPDPTPPHPPAKRILSSKPVAAASGSRPHATRSTRTLTPRSGYHSDCPFHKPCPDLSHNRTGRKLVCEPKALMAVPEPSPRGRGGRSRHRGPHL